MFTLGVLLGLLVSVIAGGLAGFAAGGLAGFAAARSRPRLAGVLVCVGELVVFLVLLRVVISVKRRGLLQGFLTGSALAFLLCATCWGLIAIKGG